MKSHIHKTKYGSPYLKPKPRNADIDVGIRNGIQFWVDEFELMSKPKPMSHKLTNLLNRGDEIIYEAAREHQAAEEVLRSERTAVSERARFAEQYQGSV